VPFTFFKTKTPKAVSEAGKIVSGNVLSIKGDYKSPKTGFEKIKDDFLMDIGAKEKDVDYYARLDDRKARSKAASKNLGKDIFGNEVSETKKTKSVKDKKAEERKLAIQKLRDEARERRRKFYQQKDIETLNIRQRLGLA